ncbi:hypothetical protein M5689_000782 [Euphorbia peplus]|nr:hypothetical protein M5689_000782 [Euphorbia peplus]
MAKLGRTALIIDRPYLLSCINIWISEEGHEPYFLKFLIQFASLDHWFGLLEEPSELPYGLFIFNMWDVLTIEPGNSVRCRTHRRFYLEASFRENPMTNPIKHKTKWRWIKDLLVRVNGMNPSEVPPELLDPCNYCFDGRIKLLPQILPIPVLKAYRRLFELHYGKTLEEIDTPLDEDGDWREMHQHCQINYFPRPDDQLWIDDNMDFYVGWADADLWPEDFEAQNEAVQGLGVVYEDFEVHHMEFVFQEPAPMEEIQEPASMEEVQEPEPMKI